MSEAAQTAETQVLAGEKEDDGGFSPQKNQKRVDGFYLLDTTTCQDLD